MQLNVPAQNKSAVQLKKQISTESAFVPAKSAFSGDTSHGPNHQMLNKDNSILEIAKMQNSNGSQSDNYVNQSLIDRDFLQADTPADRQMFPKKPVTVHSNARPQVSDFVDKENTNSNNILF
jgi:hypothetical protein